MSRSAIRMAVAAAFLLAVASLVARSEPGAPPPDRRITVGPNVHVSAAHPSWAHYEIQLAADPVDPQRLLGCSIVTTAEKNQSWSIVYLSTDAGKSWTQTLLDDSSVDVIDPACEFGIDGMAYFTTTPVAYDIPGQVKRMLFYRSPDGGKTWARPLSMRVPDREYITVDTTGGRYNGRIYIQGRLRAGQLRPLGLYRSMDNGATFAPMIEQATEEDFHGNGTGNGVVLSDGTFVAISRELIIKNAQDRRGTLASGKPMGRLVLLRSETGGETLEKPTPVADWYECPIAASCGMPSLAIDRTSGPFRDRLYVTWPDYRSGHCEILFTVSADKGKTWLRPTVVNDDRLPRAPGAPAPTITCR
jgi:hypothetical protein